MASSMAISPQIQNYGQDSGPEREEQLFRERFNQMAYAALSAKFADIMQYIVTFKIIETDLDNSFGVGVFVLDFQNKPVYIPVVLNDGLLKPLEILYYKSLNAFLPLNTSWLDEISKMNVEDMGEGADIPKGMQQNVNIRGLVIPPTTTGGREGYASVDTELTPRMLFKEAEVQNFSPEPEQFLKIITTSPTVVLDGIKVAFQSHPEFLQKCAEVYGLDKLMSALDTGYKEAQKQHREKTASLKKEGSISVLTSDAPEDKIMEVFGKNAGEAFSKMLKDGYAVSDTRNNIKNAAVKIERPVFLDTPGPNPAWYRLYFTDAPPDEFFIVPFPKSAESGIIPANAYYYGSGRRVSIEYLVISKDGKIAWTTDSISGERIEVETPSIKKSKIYKILNGGKGVKPKVNSYGYFMHVDGKKVDVTIPSKIDAVYSADGYTKYLSDYHTPYIVDKSPIRKSITIANNSVYLPSGTVFVEMYVESNEGPNYGRKRRENDNNRLKQLRRSIVDDPKMLHGWFDYVMQQTDAQKPSIKTAGLKQWWLNGISTPVSTPIALEKLAKVHDITAEDAYNILKEAEQYGTADVYIIPKDSLGSIKEAFDQYTQETPMDYQSVPGQQTGLPMMGDPSMMSPSLGTEMDPSQLGDPMRQDAPPINPTDLAIGEAVQDLQVQSQQQMANMDAQMSNMQAQLDMQQQNTEQLVSVLQGIQQRSSEIAQATNGSVPENVMASPSVAAKALAPIPPVQSEPAPMPMMTQDGFSPELIAEQINPALAEQAGSFNDAGMFDTAAVGMLASSPILQDVVSTYVPNLEKAVDNLGRILLTLWMKEDDTKESIGEDAFILLEDKLRTVFKNLGEVVLSLSKNAVNAAEEAEKAQMVMQAKQG